MGPIWGRQDPGGPHVGPMNLAIWVAHWPLGDPYVIIEFIIFKFISGVDLLSISCEIVLRWMIQDLTGDLSTLNIGSGNGLVPSDCMMPYGITRPPQSLRQWHCWVLCWIWSGLSNEISCWQTQFFKIWVQGSPFPTARWPGASKTTSRASGFGQIFLLYFM